MNKHFLRLLGIILAGSLMRCGSAPKTSPERVEIRLAYPVYERVVVKKLTPAGELVAVDTVELEGGEGVYEFPSAQPELYFISNGTENIPVFSEAGPVRLYIDSTFQQSATEGGRMNAAYREYVRHRDSLKNLQKEWFVKAAAGTDEDKEQAKRKMFALEEEISDYSIAFAKQHPDMAGTFVLIEKSFDKNQPVKELFDIYQTYPESVKKSSAGKYLTKRLNDLSAGAIGMRMQNFTAPDPEGKLISLYSVMGKVTIVDFWASWCKPCRVQNPHLVELYEKYHDRGLNVISVSLDQSKEAWLQAIEEDGLPWYHVSHLQGWKEPVARQFNVRYIPQTFIIDKQGILRYKNLRGEELEEKIRELLEE